MKTHLVLDLTRLEEEGQECFVGTQIECERFVETQNTFGYKTQDLIDFTNMKYDKIEEKEKKAEEVKENV